MFIGTEYKLPTAFAVPRAVAYTCTQALAALVVISNLSVYTVVLLSDVYTLAIICYPWEADLPLVETIHVFGATHQVFPLAVADNHW
jgi:hypothetical protein